METESKNFATTHWTCVARSRGDGEVARAALSELCESYYAPVQAFIRTTVRDADASQELTQAFFVHVLSKKAFDGADPEKGKFRSYLLGAVKHFLHKTWENTQAQKRGGGKVHVPIEPGTDTSPGIDPIDEKALSPDAEFDRRWALTMLARSLEKLGTEMESEEKGELFRILKPWLMGDHAGLRQGDAAVALGINDNAVKVAIHRLRRRFRDMVKAEVAHTLSDPNQVEEELRHLEAVLRR
jgi:DNA-directed RNA polymerase specialized sigma24 family protein